MLLKQLGGQAVAAESAWKKKGGETLTSAGACALSAAHDLLMVRTHHAHDAHFPLYFWPTEKRHVIIYLLKVSPAGNVVLDVLDLRKDKKKPNPVVQCVLVAENHARPG